LIGRDAPVIAVSPVQNFLKPPPVPDTPMVTRAGFPARNSSATASVMGNTVLDPSMAMIADSARLETVALAFESDPEALAFASLFWQPASAPKAVTAPTRTSEWPLSERG
jgi:hypothetical protein